MTLNLKTDQRGPDVWSPRELKEWLAENRVYYKGIPEKDELVVLVKRHWRDTKQKEDTITSYVDEFMKYLESCKYHTLIRAIACSIMTVIDHATILQTPPRVRKSQKKMRMH